MGYRDSFYPDWRDEIMCGPGLGKTSKRRPGFVECDYGHCRNGAKYSVEFIAPPDEKGWRHREQANRCYWHRNEKFFPEGSTGITWSNLPTDSATDCGPIASDD